MDNGRINKETLEAYGYDFQLMAVKALLEQPNLLGSIYKILDQNCFTAHSPWLKTIVGLIKEYFKNTGVIPAYYEIDAKLVGKFTNETDLQYSREVLEKVKNANTAGVETIQEQLTDFFQKKHRRAAIVEYTKDAAYDKKTTKKLLKKLEEAECIGFDETVYGGFGEEDLRRVFTKSDKSVVPTYINGLDEKIRGGIARGELGIFLAATGRGKTTFGIYITHKIAINGYKALHIYFEDDREDILAKHIAMETNVDCEEIQGKTNEVADVMIERFTKYPNYHALLDNLKTIRMKDADTTVDDIENKLKELANTEGFRPDVVVIDYFSCLKHSSAYNTKSYEAEAVTMKQLVALAMKYNIALWVLQQSNRNGASSESQADIANWQGSWQATQPSTVYLELRRTDEQMQEGTADLVFHKTRHKGFTGYREYDIIYRNGIPEIDCRDTKEYNPNEEK